LASFRYFRFPCLSTNCPTFFNLPLVGAKHY
jgi:hypothetical protein